MSGVVIPFPVPVRDAAEPSCPCERRLQQAREVLRLWLHPRRTVRMARSYERSMTVFLHTWAAEMREYRGG